MTDTESVKIEFPCADYPIKIMGDAHLSFHGYVLQVMDKHAPGFDPAKVTLRESRNGRYISITVFITATGETQLKAIFEDLKLSAMTKMVL